MTFWELPPVGRKVDINAGYVPTPVIPGYRACWLNSGTAALALALCVAKAKHDSGTHSTAQVILPAYGCPDLVAAAVYAGLQPILVDIGESDPGYNLGALQGALNSDVVAVVVVNFLGIADRLEEIRKMVDAQSSALLIEDNAQCFPEAALTAPQTLHGDLVITSFGRGKPVNLMGGGVLWAKDDLAGLAISLAPTNVQTSEPAPPDGRARIKGAIFNLALHPRVYYWLSRLPGLGVGKTEYHALQEIAAMPQATQFLLGAHIASYVGNTDTRCQVFDQVFREMPQKVSSLPLAFAGRAQRLLRYPLLYTGPGGDVAIRRLRNRKLGISGMYQQPLIEIPDVRPLVVESGGNTGAQAFAARLLTLPIHAGATTRITKEILMFLQTHL